jgi:hypothetical protein
MVTIILPQQDFAISIVFFKPVYEVLFFYLLCGERQVFRTYFGFSRQRGQKERNGS